MRHTSSFNSSTLNPSFFIYHHIPFHTPTIILFSLSFYLCLVLHHTFTILLEYAITKHYKAFDSAFASAPPLLSLAVLSAAWFCVLLRGVMGPL